MKFYWRIRFNGKLNKEDKVCDLIVIEFDTGNQIPYVFSCDLAAYLYRKRGKTKELGPKNGLGTSGWLEVKNLFSPRFCPNVKIVRIDNLNLDEVYKIIRPHLREAIDEKIKNKRRVKENEKNKMAEFDFI